MPNDSEYTPTTEEVREKFAQDEYGVPKGRWLDEFDRWLAEHDRQVAEKAWERAEFAFERAHNADMLEPWKHVPDNPYREGQGDE